MIKRLYTFYFSIPNIVRSFLIKGVLIIVVWQVLYIFLLEPNRVIDIPLTHIATKHTVWVLSHFYNDVDMRTTYRGVELLIGGKHAIGVADGCNGLALFVVYLGFILCFPIQLRRLALFSVGGVLFIYIMNIARISGLAYVNLNIPSYMDFAHHYVFKILVYSAIFYLWVLYSKRYLSLNGNRCIC